MSLRLLRIGLLTLAAISATSALGEAQEPPRLTGRIIEAGNGTPLGGVMVGLPDSELHVLTNDQGVFTLPDIEPGIHRVVVDLLGYGPLDRAFRILASEPLVIALNIQPISLKAIEVEVDRLDRRRQHAGTASFIYTDRDLEAQLQDVATFLSGRGQMRRVSCRVLSGCLRSRGQTIALYLFVDDHAAVGGYEYLSGFPPELIARIETYPACGMVRVYTKRHLERLAKTGGRLLPIACSRQRVP